MIPVNFVAIIGATIVSMILGFLWYGPLFGKEWMRLSGLTQEHMAAAKKNGGMTRSYVMMMIGTLVTNYVLAHAVIFASSYLMVYGASAGLMVGFWNWLGLVAPVTMGVVLWEGKPWKLWCITSGYYLVSLAVGGVILSVWR